MDLQEFTDTSGQIRLFTESGRSLVSGTSVSALSYTTTPYMTANETYPGSISGITLNGATNDITADITTGKLGALIEMRDKQLERKSDVSGKSVSDRLDLGGRGIIQKKKLLTVTHQAK